MNPENKIASELLVGTTLWKFSFGQNAFTLNFSRWSRKEAFGKPLPFEVALETQGSTQIDGARSWEDARLSYDGTDEALVASLLVQLCQSGGDALVNRVEVVGTGLEVSFVGGSRIVVVARPGAMGPDWVIIDNPPGTLPRTVWSVYSEGGSVGSKRP